MPHSFHHSLVQYANQYLPPVATPGPAYATSPLRPTPPPFLVSGSATGQSGSGPYQKTFAPNVPSAINSIFASHSISPASIAASLPPSPASSKRRNQSEPRQHWSVTFEAQTTEDMMNRQGTNARSFNGERRQLPQLKLPPAPSPPPYAPPPRVRAPHKERVPRLQASADDIREYNLTGYKKGSVGAASMSPSPTASPASSPAPSMAPSMRRDRSETPRARRGDDSTRHSPTAPPPKSQPRASFPHREPRRHRSAMVGYPAVGATAPPDAIHIQHGPTPSASPAPSEQSRSSSHHTTPRKTYFRSAPPSMLGTVAPPASHPMQLPMPPIIRRVSSASSEASSVTGGPRTKAVGRPALYLDPVGEEE